jgi:hypothetical protein
LLDADADRADLELRLIKLKVRRVGKGALGAVPTIF